MIKIFDHDSESFLKVKRRKFYVFEEYIIFRNKDGIFAIPHFPKQDGKNVVDLFEEEFAHLELKYECMADIGSEDIAKVRKKLKNI